MGLVQHRQIKDRLEQEYCPLIDVSDVPENAREASKLSRALGAYALTTLTDVDVATACSAIVDGFGDNGIDAIYFDATEKTLYIVQSKWNSSHGESIDNASILKLLNGTKDLLNSKYDKFNEKVKSRVSEIDRAISNASKVVIIPAYSGSGRFSTENKSAADSFIEDVDETRELVAFFPLGQEDLHKHLLAGVQGATISETLQIFYWGYLDAPAKAYYGQIAASDLVALYRKYGHKLFSKNIRMFLGIDSVVNRGIIETLEHDPENFWYYNNGITVLANKVTRKAIGGTSRDAGQFDCEALNIVNGAQTVGSLAASSDTLEDQLATAKVPIRVISLESATPEFSVSVARNTNTQNKIDSRNFVALDPEQERLKAEFMVDAIDYEYREGAIETSSPNRLGFVEATIALACTDTDVNLSTLAKREVGRLWDDIDRPPYKNLFNSSQSSDAIWKRVRAFRRLDGALSQFSISLSGKKRNIAIHGNRFVVHMLYRYFATDDSGANLVDVTDEKIAQKTKDLFDSLCRKIEEHYPDNYVASLFKNQNKCRFLKSDIFGK